MNKTFGGIVLDVSTRLVIPFSVMYAIYVLAAGESGPGGGFQAGAVLALGVLCSRLLRRTSTSKLLRGAVAASYAGLGTFLYCLMGWIPMLNGGHFLEYGKLPIHMHAPELHAMGITLIETGVTICVAMTIITILEALIYREDLGEVGEDDD